jgi:hypothetical protein
MATRALPWGSARETIWRILLHACLRRWIGQGAKKVVNILFHNDIFLPRLSLMSTVIHLQSSPVSDVNHDGVRYLTPNFTRRSQPVLLVVLFLSAVHFDYTRGVR